MAWEQRTWDGKDVDHLDRRRWEFEQRSASDPDEWILIKYFGQWMAATEAVGRDGN